MVHLRRRGTAIVENPKGILVVSESGRTYSLVGGNARRRESRRRAVIRELREETGLEAIGCTYLFEYISTGTHKDYKGGYFRTAHKVFLMETIGVAKPRGEIRYVSYFNGCGLKLFDSTREIIKKYYEMKKKGRTWSCEYCKALNEGERCHNCGSVKRKA